MTTLAERLKEAMAGPPKVSGVALAAACGVKPPSVSGWRTGDSKTLEGKNLLAAADKLGVRAKWLADGTGPMRPDKHYPENHTAQVRVAGYIKPKIYDVWTLEAITIMENLKKSERPGAVAALKTHIQHLAPPRVGQTLPVAGKTEGGARIKKTT